MINRLISVVALATLTVLSQSCGSGGSGASSSYGYCSVTSGGDTTFCLVSCSLGCSLGSCTVTDIAANQPIKLSFSRDVDPATVDFNTVSIKTSSGRAPEGRLDVSKNSIEFVPEVKVVGGVTSFGFVANETYVLTLPDASESGFVLKSTSGDPLTTALTCVLHVTQGIVDLDRAPPKATLVSPIIRPEGVPADSVIILEFSEIIDIAGFQGSTTYTSPVKYEIRKTMADPSDPTRRICNPNSNSKVVEGLPIAENVSGRNITTVTLRPAVPLPSQVCVRVIVTDQVHDLAGTAAEEQVFEFTTKILVSGEVEARESFVSDQNLDKSVSGGVWGSGKAVPPRLGGTGIHGSFDAQAGTPSTSGLQSHYVWNTDSQFIKEEYCKIPGGITVTGGVFEFTDFFLPADFILEFEGSNPAQIRVRGHCRVDGHIWANAKQAPYFLAIPNPAQGPLSKGQEAAPGGPGGGAGGIGGDSCKNQGPSAAYNGGDGSDVVLPNGNGYGPALGTGGKGSFHFPATGRILGYCALNNQFAGFIAAGGAGGGFHATGESGQSILSPCTGTKYLEDNPSPGGIPFPLGTYAPKTPGPDASLLHYTVGGSGGGGGGSQPFISRALPVTASYWTPGSSGAGGGGIVVFRVGQTFLMSTGSTLQAKGGDGYVVDSVNTVGEYQDSLFNVPTPGGGGSGGSILIQAINGVVMNGLLDTSGGAGGVLDNAPLNQSYLKAKSMGGDGSPGYFRLETLQGMTFQQAGNTIPVAAPTNVGTLTDEEFKGVSQSKFYSTRLTFPPNFLRYEVEAVIDGNRVLYSDDSSLKDPDFKGPAHRAEPVFFQVQGAEVSPVTGLPINTPTAWRDFVYSSTSASLNDDNATGFRFRLSYDTQGGQKTIEVRRVSVFFVE